MIPRLREILAPALSRAGLDTTRDVWTVADRWSELVGPAIAARATPLGLSRGELLVAVPEAVWRQELALLAPEIKDKINSALGQELVLRIRLVGGAPVGPTEPRLERRLVPGSGAAPRGRAGRTTESGGAPGPASTAADSPAARPDIEQAIAALSRARAARLRRESGRGPG